MLPQVYIHQAVRTFPNAPDIENDSENSSPLVATHL